MTGEVPFVAETAFSMALMHINAPPRAPRQLNPTIPAALGQVILRAMAKNPAERFQTAAEMVAALRAALPGDGAPEVGTAPNPIPSASKSLTAPTGRIPMPLAQPTPAQAAVRFAHAAPGPRSHRRSFRSLLIALLIVGFASTGAVFTFPKMVQRTVPTQRYVPKGTFTIQDQQIIVPSGRDVEGAFREAFVVLARQDPRFGPNADINPTAPPTFIGQAQKIRDEPRGMIYRATMQGVVLVPQG
jgi:hypothetical protein